VTAFSNLSRRITTPFLPHDPIRKRNMAEIIYSFPRLTPEQQEIILNGPSLVPPPGVMWDFDNPPSQNRMALAFGIVCTTVVTFLYFLKAYVRFFKARKVEVVDVLGLLAFVSTDMRYLGLGSSWAKMVLI
jgi:hypothetical protein